MNELLRRRRALMAQKQGGEKFVLHSGIDFGIYNGGANYYTEGGTTNFRREGNYSGGAFARTRLCMYKAEADETPPVTDRGGGLTGETLYPIKIPNGATKISVTSDKPVQMYVFGAMFQNGAWTTTAAIARSGWVDDLTEFNIEGCSHIGIAARVDASQPDFTDSTRPTNAVITFAR